MTDDLTELGVLVTFILYFSALALYDYSNVPSYFTVIKDPFKIFFFYKILDNYEILCI